MTDTLGRIGVGLLIGIIGLVVIRALVGAAWGIVSLVAFVFAVLAIIDVAGSGRSTASKVIWIAIIVLIPIVGTLAYWLVAKA
ncbi:MAG: PLDc N-terminal domain-containing protein [Acidimicrobiia bacterium]|nr:PLDc N-terminal domain-containing protein [Acidimicrobiia bacterium]